MILGYQQRIFKAAAKEATRYALNTIYVAPSEEEGYAALTATDGRKMVQVLANLEEGEEILAPVLLDASDIRRAWGTGKGPRFLWDTGHGWTLQVRGRVFPIRERGGIFPEYDDSRLSPTPGKGFRVGIDPKLLMDMAKAAGSHDVVLEFCEKDVTSGEATSCIRVAGKGIARGLVVPTRVDKVLPK